MPVKPTTLGSDYSGSAVYLGCLQDNKVIATASLDMTHPKTGVGKLREVLAMYKEGYGVEKIWVEESWINGMKFPRSGLMLTRIATFIEVAAYDTELYIEFVHPLTWRKAVYGKAKPANPKEVARRYAKELFDFDTKFKNQHNICEAIMLAQYGAIQNS